MRHDTIYIKDAVALLKDRKPHTLRVWKMSTGDIITYTEAVYMSSNERGGTITVRVPRSREVRCFRRICLFEIDNLKIYL